MFDFTPPRWRNVVKCGSVLLLAFICFSAYFRGYQAGTYAMAPVPVPPSILCNRDSMLYYAERAYLDNDPKALFLTAAGYYAKSNGLYPDTLYIPTVDRQTAEEFLYLSASMDFPPAVRLVNLLRLQGEWAYAVPDNRK